MIGAINGIVVWNVSTSPLIITLGSLTLLRGVVYIVTDGQAMTGMPNSFTDFGNSEPFGLPTPVWMMLAATAVGFVFLAWTKTGRHVYAIGGNLEASRAAGIRIRRIVIGAFLVNGLLVGLTGVLEASFYGSPDSTFGNGFELQVITGVIVGGVSFAGGEGGVVRALFGVLLLEVVSGAVVSLGHRPELGRRHHRQHPDPRGLARPDRAPPARALPEGHGHARAPGARRRAARESGA